MDKSLSDKQKEVIKWLQDIFGDEPVPSFHSNNAFIDHLHTLMKQERQLGKQGTLHADFVNSLTQDYTESLSSTVAVLNRMGLASSVDSPNIETNVLASVASTLSLGSLDEPSFILSLTKLIMEKEQTVSEVGLAEKTMAADCQKLAESIQVNKQLEALLGNLSKDQSDIQSKIKKQTADISFLQTKTNKYKAEQRKHEARLAKSGLNDSLTHDRLVADYNELQEVNKRLQKTNEELEKFAALPADKVLAKVKLEVAKSELRELEDEIVKQIDLGCL